MWVHTDQYIFNRGHVLKETDVLVRACDPKFRDAIGGQSLDDMAIEPNFTFVWLIKTCNAVKEGRLSCTVRPNDAVDCTSDSSTSNSLTATNPPNVLVTFDAERMILMDDLLIF